MIYSVYIVNKSGGLILQRNSEEGQRLREEKLESLKVGSDPNDLIYISSMFFAFNVFSQNICPCETTGKLLEINTANYNLRCLHTKTDIKFFAFGDLKETNLDNFLEEVYCLFCDYALKNPWYAEINQPAHTCERFVKNVDYLMAGINSNPKFLEKYPKSKKLANA